MLACSSEVLAFLNVCNARNLGGCSVKEKKGGIFAAHGFHVWVFQCLFVVEQIKLDGRRLGLSRESFSFNRLVIDNFR